MKAAGIRPLPACSCTVVLTALPAKARHAPSACGRPQTSERANPGDSAIVSAEATPELHTKKTLCSIKTSNARVASSSHQTFGYPQQPGLSRGGGLPHLLQLVPLHARARGLRAAGPDEQLRQPVVVEHVVREVRLGLYIHIVRFDMVGRSVGVLRLFRVFHAGSTRRRVGRGTMGRETREGGNRCVS